jgi:AcrR family transcriptional regulator
MTRKYELKRRAERQAETRRRITEATVELHRTVGPAHTRIADVARRAGVTRPTVYGHFPDEESLFAACSAHWRALHPAPDPAGWSALRDRPARLRAGLAQIYRWYGETEAMTGNVLRDMEQLPALRRIVGRGLGRYLATARETLAQPFRATGARRKRLHAALDAALDFHFWRRLSALGEREASELAASFVELAAQSRAPGPPHRRAQLPPRLVEMGE